MCLDLETETKKVFFFSLTIVSLIDAGYLINIAIIIVYVLSFVPIYHKKPNRIANSTANKHFFFLVLRMITI